MWCSSDGNWVEHHGHAKGKGQKAQEGGDSSPVWSYRWVREWETSLEEDEAHFISVLQLLTTLCGASRLLENSNSCYLFLCTSGQLGSLRHMRTALAPWLSPSSSAAAPGCAMYQSRSSEEALAWKTGGIGSLWAVRPGSAALPFMRRGAVSCPEAEEKQISSGPCGLWLLEQQRTNQPCSWESVEWDGAPRGLFFITSYLQNAAELYVTSSLGHFYCTIIHSNSCFPNGGCLLKSESPDNCADFQLIDETLQNLECWGFFFPANCQWIICPASPSCVQLCCWNALTVRRSQQKQSGSVCGTQLCGPVARSFCWGRWTDAQVKAFLIFSHFFFVLFLFFQGPIGLDGKPVSKQPLSRLCTLPPARSHSPTSLHATEYVLKRIILQCHVHAWIKWKSEVWQAGRCHKCLRGDTGVKRLGRECGCFLSRQTYEPAPHKGSSQPAARKSSVFWVLGSNVMLAMWAKLHTCGIASPLRNNSGCEYLPKQGVSR